MTLPLPVPTLLHLEESFNIFGWVGTVHFCAEHWTAIENEHNVSKDTWNIHF